MQIRLDRQSDVPIYRQISEYLKARILDGTLPAGYRLPPERTMARDLGVNRTTVMNAYAELKADGLLHGRVGDGTRVVAIGRDVPAEPAEVQPLRWSDFARGPSRPSDDEVRRLLALSEGQGVIVLSLGFPALDAIPMRMLREAAAGVFEERGPAALFYAPAEGVSSFRQALAAHMQAGGAPVAAEEIVVTSGSQQALDVIARTLIEPGDTVVVEEPTYLGALQCLRTAGARLVSVPVDGDGMRTDLLENLLGRYSPKLIYTLPTFQNPSGAVMSLERRMRLLDLAYRFRVPVVEDDVYGELWYDEPPPPTLKALDRHGFVLYAGSFSKVLCPGLRVGWIAGPRPLIRRLVQVKQIIDLQAPTLSQMMIERLLVSGGFARHLESVRKSYAPRRDAMERSLKRHAGGWAEWSAPCGGFYYWLRVDSPVPVAALAAEAAEKRVSILPGSTCTAVESTDNRVRLSFSCANPEEIEEGIARLARVVRHANAHARAASEPMDAIRPLI